MKTSNKALKTRGRVNVDTRMFSSGGTIGREGTLLQVPRGGGTSQVYRNGSCSDVESASPRNSNYVGSREVHLQECTLLDFIFDKVFF